MACFHGGAYHARKASCAFEQVSEWPEGNAILCQKCLYLKINGWDLENISTNTWVLTGI